MAITLTVGTPHRINIIGTPTGGSGTATAGGTRTLTDTGKAWTVNEHAGRIVAITGGTGVGQQRQIMSNTATVLTMRSDHPDWATTPDSTSTYVIGWNNEDVYQADKAGILILVNRAGRTAVDAAAVNNTYHLHPADYLVLGGTNNDLYLTIANYSGFTNVTIRLIGTDIYDAALTEDIVVTGTGINYTTNQFKTLTQTQITAVTGAGSIGYTLTQGQWGMVGKGKLDQWRKTGYSGKVTTSTATTINDLSQEGAVTKLTPAGSIVGNILNIWKGTGIGQRGKISSNIATTKAISAFADAGGGNVTVTCTANGFTNGNTIRIYGTTNYNGVYTVANKTTNTFNIVATWVATETGTAAKNEITVNATWAVNPDSTSFYRIGNDDVYTYVCKLRVGDNVSNSYFFDCGKVMIFGAGICSDHYTNIWECMGSKDFCYLGLCINPTSKATLEGMTIWNQESNWLTYIFERTQATNPDVRLYGCSFNKETITEYDMLRRVNIAWNVTCLGGMTIDLSTVPSGGSIINYQAAYVFSMGTVDNGITLDSPKAFSATYACLATLGTNYTYKPWVRYSQTDGFMRMNTYPVAGDYIRIINPNFLNHDGSNYWKVGAYGTPWAGTVYRTWEFKLRVLDENGNAISGATITMTNTGGSNALMNSSYVVQTSLTTDTNGDITTSYFDDVYWTPPAANQFSDPNYYSPFILTIRKSGYEDYKLKFSTPNDPGGTPPVYDWKIKMKRPNLSLSENIKFDN
jgi:hypothetical protein